MQLQSVELHPTVPHTWCITVQSASREEWQQLLNRFTYDRDTCTLSVPWAQWPLDLCPLEDNAQHEQPPPSLVRWCAEYRAPPSPVDPSLHIPADTWTRLYDYQREGVAFLCTRDRAYIGDEMGLGKTVQCLLAAYYHRHVRGGAPVVIVCPASLVSNWKRELKFWVPDETVQVWDRETTVLAHDGQPGDGFTLMSYSLLVRKKVSALLLKRWKKRRPVVVCDEAHYLNNTRTGRYRAFRKLSPHLSVLILASGTPMDVARELYAVFHLCAPGMFTVFFEAKYPRKHYAARYCDPQERKVYYQGHPGVEWTHKGSERMPELRALITTFTVRRTKHDVLESLPPKRRTVVRLPPPPKDVTLQVEQALSRMDKTSFMEAYRALVPYRAPHVTKYLAQHLAAWCPVLVFYHHVAVGTELVTWFADTFPDRAFATIDGSVPKSKRDDIQARFQCGLIDVLFLSIQAASVGLNFTRSHRVIFAELLFTPKSMLQAEDRVHRIGQQADHVECIYLLFGPLDTRIYGLLQRKANTNSQIMDNDPTTMQTSQWLTLLSDE